MTVAYASRSPIAFISLNGGAAQELCGMQNMDASNPDDLVGRLREIQPTGFAKFSDKDMEEALFSNRTVKSAPDSQGAGVTVPGSEFHVSFDNQVPCLLTTPAASKRSSKDDALATPVGVQPLTQTMELQRVEDFPPTNPPNDENETPGAVPSTEDGGSQRSLNRKIGESASTCPIFRRTPSVPA